MTGSSERAREEAARAIWIQKGGTAREWLWLARDSEQSYECRGLADAALAAAFPVLVEEVAEWIRTKKRWSVFAHVGDADLLADAVLDRFGGVRGE